jgi:hypothetical protein
MPASDSDDFEKLDNPSSGNLSINSTQDSITVIPIFTELAIPKIETIETTAPSRLFNKLLYDASHSTNSSSSLYQRRNYSNLPYLHTATDLQLEETKETQNTQTASKASMNIAQTACKIVNMLCCCFYRTKTTSSEKANSSENLSHLDTKLLTPTNYQI